MSKNIPGLDLLGHSYDIFKSDYCNLRDTGPLLFEGLDLSKQDTKKGYVQIGKVKYQCPEFVKPLTDQAKSYQNVSKGKTVEAFLSDFSCNAGLSAKYMAFQGSISSKFGKVDKIQKDIEWVEIEDILLSWYLIMNDVQKNMRSHLLQNVKVDIDSMPPEELIDCYGTHYVSKVSIGGKTSYNQLVERQTKISEEDSINKVKASYNDIVGSAKFEVGTRYKDEQYRDDLKSDLTIRILGGTNSGQYIREPKDFKAWADTVHERPAIIDFGEMIPLWKLCDFSENPDRGTKVKETITKYARKYQPGIVGSRQSHSDMTRKIWINGQTWGTPDVGRAHYAWQSRAYTKKYNWSNSKVELHTWYGNQKCKSPHIIVGGCQIFNDKKTSRHHWKEKLNWGTYKGIPGIEKITVAYGEAWSEEYGWGNSQIILFVLPADSDIQEGHVIVVGGRQDFNVLDSTKAWITGPSWGVSPTEDKNVKEQLIGKVCAWNKDYGWGNSNIYLYLSEMVQSEDLESKTPNRLNVSVQQITPTKA